MQNIEFFNYEPFLTFSYRRRLYNCSTWRRRAIKGRPSAALFHAIFVYGELLTRLFGTTIRPRYVPSIISQWSSTDTVNSCRRRFCFLLLTFRQRKRRILFQ